MHLDVGTGDGAYVYQTARARPDTLFVGVDANADALREVSRRAAAKPTRGGLANALFGRLALDEAPGELAGAADTLSVLFPWGTLLRAVARPETRALARLRSLCKPGARVWVVFGYDPAADARAIREHALPPLDAPAYPLELAAGYHAAGFTDVCVGRYAPQAAGAAATSWSRRLAFSGRRREFVELLARGPAGV